MSILEMNILVFMSFYICLDAVLIRLGDDYIILLNWDILTSYVDVIYALEMSAGICIICYRDVCIFPVQ